MNPADQSDPARNLLFGLLAFQLNFIDRRALLAAFDAWTADKSRPLGRVLVDQNALTTELLALIDGLVAAHLAKHDNEPEKSLAALTPIGSVRKDLEALADPEARATLSQVSIEPSHLDPDATNLESVGDRTSAGTRFRVLRPLNKGGMGVVSVALDTELDRSIALKEIRDTAAHDVGYRARFLAEAEITGKLEHPGIIPIYGLGTYADGRPFYAMRLIRGDKTGSLMEAIERFYKEPDPASRVVEFRGLLRRFLDVCNALSYAHSKGVLHRDLKPDNILLGPYGETLVVDWGLAKAAGKADLVASHDGDQVRLNLSGSELSPTMAGGAMGTPEYAPPEQMTGDLPNIGPRSDVYGLGAVLYCLMTGQAPFSRKGIDLGKLIMKIENGDFPPPRHIRADADKPLEAICLKAMARKPADRYESVRTLAGEIEHYLADEPVTAYREPWTVRARRAARKRRTLVSSVATALVVALVGLGAISAVQTKARHDLTRKNSALNQANAQVTKANRELTAANTALDEQRQRAEDREALAIHAVERFRDAIVNEPELKKTPALEALRKRLLNEPLAFFRSLRERLQADRDTRPESLDRLAKASFELSFLIHEIGNLQDALIALREAVAIQQKLADASPTNTKFQSDLARSYNNLGVELFNSGKPAEALRAHESALPIWRKLVDADPTVARAQYELAQSHFNIGEVLSSSGKPAEALKAYETALTIAQKQAETNPKITEFQSQQAVIHFQIGMLLERTGKMAAALTAYETALTIRQKLVDAHPTVTDFQSPLAQSHNNIGIHLRVAGKHPEALRAYEAARAIRQKLVENNPTNTSLQGELAASEYNIATLLDVMGRPAEAMDAFQSAIALHQKLVDANPAVPVLQHRLALCHLNMGGLLSSTGKPAEALKEYDSALETLKKLVDDNPTVIDFQSALATGHDNRGAVLYNTGKPSEALKSFESALAIRQKLVDANPTTSRYQSELAMSHNNIAAIDLNARRFEPARVRLRESMKWQRMALESNPANSGDRRHLASSLTNLIAASRALGDSAGAAEAERELAELRDSDPAIKALDSRLAAILEGEQKPANEAERLQLAHRAYDKAFHETAANLWGEALEANPKLGDDRQAQHRYNAACAAALAGSGQGKDDPRPDDAAKARLRGQALTWLKAELSAWTKFAMTIGPGNKELVAKTLKHWKDDADLAGVRDETGLANVGEEERATWLALWKEVDGLLAKVQSPGS